MNNVQAIDQLFEKYKIKEPVPFEVRSNINAAKKKILINILSHDKKSLPVVITVSVLLFVKKFGINLTLFKSTILAGASALIITGAAAVTSVAVYNKFFNPNVVKNPVIEAADYKSDISESSNSLDDKYSIEKVIEAPKVHIPFEVGIMNFYSDASSSAMSSKIMAGIQQNLVKSKNPDFSGFVSDAKSSNKAKKILTGSVLKLDNLYKITLKLVDFETTQILLYISETVEKEEDISKTADSIARKILEKM